MSQRGIARFSGTERVVHLLYLVCFLTLAGTGLIFYLPQLGIYAAGEVGLLNRLIHRMAAVVLMACPLLYLVFDLRGLPIIRWERAADTASTCAGAAGGTSRPLI